MAMRKEVDCPVCQKHTASEVVVNTTLNVDLVFNIVSCKKCGTSFFNPLPTRTQLQAHYSSEYGFYAANNLKAYSRGVGFAKKYLDQKVHGKFLDIGCASGDFIDGVRQASGWDVYGTDINKDVVAKIRQRLNINVYAGEIHDVGFKSRSFDFIHVRDVLEHVLDPLGFMKECKRIIKDEGLLYLSVPNGRADLQNMVNFFQTYGELPASNAGHLFYFSPQSLNHLFSESGFSVIKKYSYGFKNGLRAYGKYPNRKNWKLDMLPYQLRGASMKDLSAENEDKPRCARSYKKLKFFVDELTKIPGILRYAHDYIYILKPIKVS